MNESETDEEGKKRQSRILSLIIPAPSPSSKPPLAPSTGKTSSSIFIPSENFGGEPLETDGSKADRRSESNNKLIEVIQDQIEKVLHKIERKKVEILRLDATVDKLNVSISNYRLKIGGIFAYKQNEG